MPAAENARLEIDIGKQPVPVQSQKYESISKTADLF